MNAAKGQMLALSKLDQQIVIILDKDKFLFVYFASLAISLYVLIEGQ
jgi:hypothetical protein